MTNSMTGSISAQSPAMAARTIAPAELSQQLSPIINMLNSFNGSTENDFLCLGALLQDFQQRSMDITSIATDMVSLVSGQEILDGIGALQSIVERMDFFLRHAAEKNYLSSSTLAKLLDVLGALDDPLAGFRKINKMLRMLGISTRIESTRLKNGGEGFDNLAHDVQQLYVQISEKASSISDLKKNLSGNILRNLDRIKAVEVVQRASVTSSLGKANSSLVMLVESNRRCSEFASSIAHASADVTGSIAEVVMSMQFHDITRQQIEHAVEGLLEITDFATGKSFTGSAEDGHEELAAEALAVSELQSAQLTHAVEELTKAVDNIVANLRGIAAKEDSIATEAREMAGSAEKGGASFFIEMEKNLTTVASALGRSAEENRSIVAALAEVEGTIDEITLFVRAIETIGEEIELIAINAQIKAARTGEEGAALGVLAEEIQSLSRDARGQTVIIAEKLNSITDVSGNMCRDMAGDTAELEGEVQEITIALKKMMTMIKELNVEFVSILERIDKGVSFLNGDLLKAADRITVHHKTEEELGKAIDGINEVISMLRPIAGSTLSSGGGKVLSELSSRYTMNSERKIHEQLSNRNSPVTQNVPVVAAASAGAGGEFGQNVELF